MKTNIPDEIMAAINLPETNSRGELKKKLIDLLNDLINKDFDALIQLLYRIDVSEKTIRRFLKEKNNNDAASVIADLIIERQLQKAESRKTYRSKNDELSNEERW